MDPSSHIICGAIFKQCNYYCLLWNSIYEDEYMCSLCAVVYYISVPCEHGVKCECVKFVRNVPLHDAYYILLVYRFVFITFTIIVRGLCWLLCINIVTVILSFESIWVYKTDYVYNSISADRFRSFKCRYRIHSVQFCCQCCSIVHHTHKNALHSGQ